MTTVNEVADAVSAADAGPPVQPWAVLLELAGVAALEGMAAPHTIEFKRRPPIRRPVLALRFDNFADAQAWCLWFGLDWQYHDLGRVLMCKPTTYRVWRGYVVLITAGAES